MILEREQRCEGLAASDLPVCILKLLFLQLLLGELGAHVV